jgi:hypothetical protein
LFCFVFAVGDIYFGKRKKRKRKNEGGKEGKKEGRWGRKVERRERRKKGEREEGRKSLSHSTPCFLGRLPNLYLSLKRKKVNFLGS